MSIAVEILAMLVYGNVLVLLHELGHAAFARPGGFRVTSFAVGLGPPLLRIPLRGGVVVHLDLWWIGGACTAIPLGPTTRRRAWYHTGGLIVQGALAVVLLLLPDVWLVDRIESFNLLVAVTNALPWRLGSSASDGWFLLDVARGGRKQVEVLPQRARLVRLLHRERQVGSPVGTTYAALCLAWADVVAGRPERADAFFEQDPPETAVEPWIDALYTYVRSEWHRLRGRPLAALDTAEQARSAREGELSEAGRGLLALATARAWVDLDDLDEATQALARIVGQAGPIGRQATVVLLWANLGGPEDDLEHAVFRVARRVEDAWLDPADTVLALREAALRLDTAGRAAPADGAREAASKLERRLQGTAAGEDRATLSSRLASRVADRPTNRYEPTP